MGQVGFGLACTGFYPRSDLVLDIRARLLENARKVVEFLCNEYSGWRASVGALAAFHENVDEPPERLLQAIWWHQRVRRDELRTVDGRGVRVLHPGFWNREAGPDFRGAVLQFGPEPPVVGDVEVDLHCRGWHGHRHDVNPAYRNVLLHVVWKRLGVGEVAPTTLPVLALDGVLDAPLTELATWLCSDVVGEFSAEHLGRCCAPLRDIPAERIGRLLRQAAAVRFRAKASHLQARARQAGWEQALWEGLFRALGYKQNVWPMQRLAELRLRLGHDSPREPLEWQARLMGAAGLLPDELPRGNSSGSVYVRELWDSWWRQRESLLDCAMPRSLWCFSGLRPSNRPERRVALAAHWLAASTLPAALEQWCAASWPDRKLVPSLAEAAQVEPDRFWSWHWTFRTPRLRRAQPLLGHTRLTDLAVNVVLPWLWVRAGEGSSPALQKEIERRYFVWPVAEDNAVLRLARRRLLGTESRALLRTAAAQQGLIQIVRDFCEQSNAVCGGCRFPELVRDWNG